MLGRDDLTVDNYEGIFEVFISDYYQGLPLPPNLTQAIWNNLTFYDTFIWFFNFGTLEEQRLLSTPIFKFWLENWDVVVQNKTNYPS